MTVKFIFHICKNYEWKAFQENKLYFGSSQDINDGFIHLSSKSQIKNSAKKHRAGQDDLILLTVDSEMLGSELKWELSRGGDTFPHYYGVLPLKSVVKSDSLKLDKDLNHIFPDQFFVEK